LRHIETVGATRLLAPPSICEKLARRHFPASLRAVLTGGGPVYPDLLRALKERVAEVVAVYGSTEAEPIAEIRASDISAEDWTSMDAGAGILAGHPVEGLRLRIDNDEILVAGAHVNKSYLDPAQNAATKIADSNGEIWHRTGDAGRIDDSGRLWLLGRMDGRIGALFPFGVEAAARLWPGVHQAALDTQDGAPVLVLSGDPYRVPEWRERAEGLGIRRVAVLPQIPLDRRHRSKVDYVALRAALGRLHR
jgi:acyl-CoA synthetase (AMP-forming)/AMP-acid ligase II